MVKIQAKIKDLSVKIAWENSHLKTVIKTIFLYHSKDTKKSISAIALKSIEIILFVDATEDETSV